MKERHGFVSNSSSSSFVIALKQAMEACPHCGRKDRDFIEDVRNSREFCDDNRVMAEGAKDVGALITDELQYYDVDNDPYLDKIEKLEKEGWQIAYVVISYHDERTRGEMEALQRKGQLEVVLDWDKDV